MKYIRTKDGITSSNKATHELIEDICDAGYLKVLKKGAYVRIDKEWRNFYGYWVDIIDEDGCHYSIRPSEVEKVTKELPQADTIEELCDDFVIIIPAGISRYGIYHARYEGWGDFKRDWRDFIEKNGDDYRHFKILGAYGAIWTECGLKYVAKMNNKGELELL